MNSVGKFVGNVLKEYRFKNKQSQEWLANLLGFARITVTKWENKGAGTATLDQVEEMAQKLEIPLSKLLGLDQAPQKVETVLNKEQFNALASQFRTLTISPLPSDILKDLESLPPALHDVAINAFRSVLAGLKNNKKDQSEAG